MPFQVEWWRDLLLKGQGEFFYVNQIDFRIPDLVTIRSDTAPAPPGDDPPRAPRC